MKRHEKCKEHNHNKQNIHIEISFKFIRISSISFEIFEITK